MRNVYIFMLFVFFIVKNVNANCELSWVSEWEGGRNWLHTSAIYPNNVKEKHFILPQVRQIKNDTKKNEIELRCVTSDGLSCEIPLKLSYKNNSCVIDQSKTSFTEGKVNENFGSISVFARTHLRQCLPNIVDSEIAIISSKKTLVIPQTYPLIKTKLEEAKKFFETNIISIRKLDGLSKIQIRYDRSLNIRNIEFLVADLYKDSLGNAVLYLNAQIGGAKNGELCSNCNDKETKKSLPILIGFINKEWLLIANGTIGQCSGYKKGLREDWERMDIPFGLPSEIIFYDSNNDKKIDFITMIPRVHLPGTKFVYFLFESQLITITELCTIADKCRPEAGC